MRHPIITTISLAFLLGTPFYLIAQADEQAPAENNAIEAAEPENNDAGAIEPEDLEVPAETEAEAEEPAKPDDLEMPIQGIDIDLIDPEEEPLERIDIPDPDTITEQPLVNEPTPGIFPPLDPRLATELMQRAARYQPDIARLTSEIIVTSDGGVRIIDIEKGIIRYEDNVDIKFRNVEIQADGADINRTTGDIVVRDNVSIYREGMLYTGESAVYNIGNQDITANKLRSSLYAQESELLFQSGELSTSFTNNETPSLIATRDTLITTHDSSRPNWFIKARDVDIFTDDRVVFRHMFIYARGIPVFYLPYLSQPLDDELGYSFSPGYDTVWGAYLLNQYGTLLGSEGHTLATFNFDLRAERGAAAGVALTSSRHRSNSNFGRLRLYYAHDTSPEISRTGGNRSDAPDNSRYRVNLQHRVYISGYNDTVHIDPNTGRRTTERATSPIDDSFYVDFDINKLSDRYFYEDFFTNEFRTEPAPDNIINIVKTSPMGSLSLLTRMRVNDFFRTDTRTPELALDLIRQPILGSNLFYESTNSFGVLDEEVPEREQPSDLTIAERLIDRGFNRFDTYHQLSYPVQLMGWLNLVPRVGARYTSYSSIENFDSGSYNRGLYHLGLDSSFKMSRIYDGIFSRKLGIDGIRHIVQPYANYSFVGGDTMPSDFPGIDRLTPTTRPRPLDVNRYTAIDSLTEFQTLRLGTFNRFQTRRDQGSYTWLTINTFIDTFFEDPEFNRDFSNLYNEISWRPLPWLSLNFESQFDVFGEEAGFTEMNSSITYMPTPWLDFTVGHRFLDSHPFLQKSNQVTFRAYARLLDEWGFSVYQRYELDDSTLETQQYSVHRDLISWTASLGAILRDNRGKDEFGMVFTMTLKEFPQFSLPVNLDPQAGTGDN